MKKQSTLRLLIVAVIVSAGLLVMAATHSSQAKSKGDCTMDKGANQPQQTEFILETLTRNLLSK
jgi:hypothetical protein